MKYISQRTIWSLWSYQYVGWSYLASKGALGGVLVMWDMRAVERVEEFVGEFTVACSFESGR